MVNGTITLVGGGSKLVWNGLSWPACISLGLPQGNV
jgi:hypothetical protein